ncbi:DUF1257 domain-containing protein [Mariniblastus sp.]|nr:DUF1257 domain-containing protein [Mariniblastus sp.]
MSHIVEITTEVRDEAAVQAACSRLHLPRATRGTFQLYSSQESGLGIELPHWKYPVVANIDSGQLRYDNYEGRWGLQEQLGQFLQMYAIEKAKIEARRKGHSVIEQRLDSGSIKLTVSVGGAS